VWFVVFLWLYTFAVRIVFTGWCRYQVTYHILPYHRWGRRSEVCTPSDVPSPDGGGKSGKKDEKEGGRLSMVVFES
jgi:hypothetical protein